MFISTVFCFFSFAYRLGGVLLAQLGLGVVDVVVVVGRVVLASLGSELVGNGTLVLGVQLLVATVDTLVVTLTLVGNGHRLVTLVTSLVEGGVTDARLTGGRHIVVDERN